MRITPLSPEANPDRHDRRERRTRESWASELRRAVPSTPQFALDAAAWRRERQRAIDGNDEARRAARDARPAATDTESLNH